MVKVALFVRLEAKPGKEKDVESFLMEALPVVMGGAGHCCVVCNLSRPIHLWNL